MAAEPVASYTLGPRMLLINRRGPPTVPQRIRGPGVLLPLVKD